MLCKKNNILMEIVKSGTVYENASHTLAFVRVACTRGKGKRMERCEGRRIARSKQAVKLPFKY